MARIPDDKKTAALLKETDWLRRLARGLVRSEADADDLVQATVFEALKRDGAEVGESRPFLATVMRRLSMKKLRSDERRQRREEAHALLRSTRDPMASIERVEAQERLIAALRRLPDLELQVLVLRFFDDLPPRKIAQQLELPLETVKSRLKRGLQKLKADLGREQNGDFRLALLPILAADLGKKSALVSSTSLIWKGAALMSTSTKIGTSAAAAVLVALSIYFAQDFATSADRPMTNQEETVVGKLDERHVARDQGGLVEIPIKSNEVVVSKPAARDVQRVQPTETGLLVRGRVLDEQGFPVEDALVLLARLGDAGYYDIGEALMNLQLRFFPHDEYNPQSVPEARTDADGRFELSTENEADQITVAAGHLTKGLGLRRNVPLLNSHEIDIEIQLQSGIIVFGRVTDEAGLPVGGAAVNLNGRKDDSYSSIGELRTDEDGRYRSMALPFNGIALSVQAEGYDHMFRRDDGSVSKGEVQMDFRLKRNLVSEAALILADGRPADILAALALRLGEQQAAVWKNEHRLRVCLSWSNPEEDIISGMIHDTATEGDFEKSRYRLSGSHKGKLIYVLAGRSVLGRAEVPATGAAPDIVIDPDLLPPIKTRCRVDFLVADKAGSPLESFMIEYRLLRDPYGLVDYSSTRQLMKNCGGKASLKGLESGLWSVEVQAKGYASRRRELELTGNMETQEFKLEPARSQLSGRVLSDMGTPLGDVTVYLLEKNQEGDFVHLITGTMRTTTELGEFQLEQLPKSRVLLILESSGFASTSQVIDLGDEPQNLTIHLRQAMKVSFNISGTSAGCSFTILDSQGLVIHEDRALGRKHHGGTQMDLPSGRLQAVVRSPTRKTLAFEFDVEDGMEIPVVFQN